VVVGWSIFLFFHRREGLLRVMEFSSNPLPLTTAIEVRLVQFWQFGFPLASPRAHGPFFSTVRSFKIPGMKSTLFALVLSDITIVLLHSEDFFLKTFSTLLSPFLVGQHRSSPCRGPPLPEKRQSHVSARTALPPVLRRRLPVFWSSSSQEFSPPLIERRHRSSPRS